MQRCIFKVGLLCVFHCEPNVSDVESGEVPQELNDYSPLRLSDVESPLGLSNYDKRLKFIDSIIEEYVFHIMMIRRNWGLNEGFAILIASAAIILGAWDLGIGELAGGGDFRRMGLLGNGESEGGFLHVNEFTLMLSLLSIICWIGLIAMLWVRFPLMRDNLVFMAVGSLAVQLGHVSSHAGSTTFPFNSSYADWIGVSMGNLILIFVLTIVVDRAVMETRDLHVQQRHAHPDPRMVNKAWRDHSLKAWRLSIITWMILINISAWSGAHSVALRPPIEQDMTTFVVIHVITAIIGVIVWAQTLWYPQFMLGNSAEKIQSFRAREVAGDLIPTFEKKRQGVCPICKSESSAVKNPDGSIEVPCLNENCKGIGEPGATCNECEDILPNRTTCNKCGASTTLLSQFTKADAW